MRIKELVEHHGGFENFKKAVDREIAALMAESPDFVYNTGGTTCYYHQGPSSNPDSCTGCIFGQAFQRLGIPNEAAAKLSGPIHYIFLAYEIPEHWTDIQKAQDEGMRWGDLTIFLPKD